MIDLKPPGHRDEIRAVHAQTQEDLELLQHRLAEMEERTPTHRQFMNRVRAAIAGREGLISDTLYHRLSDIPPPQLTIEQVCPVYRVP